MANGYVAHLRTAGKTDPTVRSYAGDRKMAVRFFGAEKQMGNFLKVHMKRLLNSDAFNKRRSGAPKTDVTVRKSRRAIWQSSSGPSARIT